MLQMKSPSSIWEYRESENAVALSNESNVFIICKNIITLGDDSTLLKRKSGSSFRHISYSKLPNKKYCNAFASTTNLLSPVPCETLQTQKKIMSMSHKLGLTVIANESTTCFITTVAIYSYFHINQNIAIKIREHILTWHGHLYSKYNTGH